MVNISFVTDQYIDEFEFKKGITWLSTWWVPIIVAPLYFAVLEATRYWIARRVQSGKKPFDLNWVVIVHNSVLSIGSAVLFIALFTELLIQMNRTGFVRVFCDQNGEFQKGRLVWYYYLNYLFKFVELFDTVLLVLRGKPTPFLHTYHHAATLILCWSQLRAQSCMQWVPIVINLFIHVVMYAYYALHAMGRDVWWKRYLTMLQIVQFVVGLIGCFGGLMPRVFYDLGFAGVPRCWGEYEGAFFGIGVIATYLLLFMDLYQKNYKDKRVSGKTADKAAGKQAVKANGHAGKHE